MADIFSVLCFFCTNISAFGDRVSSNCRNDSCSDHISIYDQISITNYEDFLIRKELDDDADLIAVRPHLALLKINKTIDRYPKRLPFIVLILLINIYIVQAQEQN